MLYSEPLAYFITFTIHGSWLHGDERGAYQRGGVFIEPNQILKAKKNAIAKDTLLRLSQEQREMIGFAIDELCARKNWQVHEKNIRTNHVHIVVTALGIKPEKVMAEIKARTTFRLRKAGLLRAEQKLWTEHGSTIYLFTDQEFLQACEYVRDCQ